MRGDKVLLLYDLDYLQANNVTDHIQSFTCYSRFDIQALNIHSAWKYSEQSHEASAEPADQILQIVIGGDFSAVILHYTLFGMDIYYFGGPLLEWLHGFRGLKIAFFQDEYYNCTKRFCFIDDYSINAVYTLVEPRYFNETYLGRTAAAFIRYTIPGFVSEGLINTARALTQTGNTRDIDVGYRGRRIDFALGRGGSEKHRIGEEFKRRAAGRGLELDIESDEDQRIYGEAWPHFLARCKAVLGVEAGVSLFDLEDAVRIGVAKMRANNPAVTEEELFDAIMKPWEGNIYYRTISPRHFETAALGTCQILFEGRYSGIMEPLRHYIPLKKDFSNFEHVLEMFLDKSFRCEVAANAQRDLIDSGRYSYQEFIRGFDTDMRLLGLMPRTTKSPILACAE